MLMTTRKHDLASSAQTMAAALPISTPNQQQHSQSTAALVGQQHSQSTMAAALPIKSAQPAPCQELHKPPQTNHNHLHQNCTSRPKLTKAAPNQNCTNRPKPTITLLHKNWQGNPKICGACRLSILHVVNEFAQSAPSM
ncbi:hypothetical protein U1Q18_040843 [Sarracenia purpurea var. burkii]